MVFHLPHNDVGGWCTKAEGTYLTWVVIGCLQLSSYTFVVFLILRTHLRLKAGDESVARNTLFPAHHHILTILFTAEFIESSTDLFTPFISSLSFSPTRQNDFKVALLYGICWAIYHFSSEGLVLLLMQSGCGKRAFKHAICLALIWAGIVCFIATTMFRNPDSSTSLTLNLCWTLFMTVFYGFVWLLPPSFGQRREAARYYARFWAITGIFYSTSTIFQYFWPHLADCIFLGAECSLFALVKTYVVYRSLMLDTQWWQGLKSSKRPKSTGLTVPLNAVAASELAEQVDRIRYTWRKLLNSAFLTVDTASAIGSGSHCKVYRGTWKKIPCAVKMIQTQDITPEEINQCISETQLLGRISHPNVVKLFGLCVLPPRLCLVLELCSKGNLFSLLHENSVPLSWPKKLQLACDVARGVDCLHRDGICHKDIKSLNFLVHEEGNERLVVKIADLDVSSEEKEVSARDVRGAPNWLAPECFSSNTFDASKADIFSVGTVLHEILYQKIPYDRLFPHHIRERLRTGQLLPLNPTTDRFVEEYLDIIRQCWAMEPERRPTAKEISEALSKLQIKVLLAQESAQE